MSEEDSQEPYRATRLWNEVILAFRTGMPMRRHRHHMRHYNDCFTASECISWLNCYLKVNPSFGPHVTRQQTMQLLQKFLKCRVIESATSKSSKTEFRDNSHLYRFVQYTPPRPTKKSTLPTLLRTPLSTRTNVPSSVTKVSKENSTKKASESKTGPQKENFDVTKQKLPECYLVERPLSVEEMENVWKSVFLKRLENLLSPKSIIDFIDPSVLSSRIIVHNMTRVSRTGVVILIDKSDDIPHWVISAMKCLANWPDASGTSSCLPKYPGFEKDVFKVVKDYFLNPQVPLVPPDFQLLLVKLFCHFMHQNCLCCFEQHQQERLVEANSCSNKEDVKTSTPFEGNKPPCNVEESSIQSVAGRIILDDSEAMWTNPLSYCFETEFTAVSPVTRVVPSHSKLMNWKGSCGSLASKGSRKSMNADTLSTMSACSCVSRRYRTAYESLSKLSANDSSVLNQTGDSCASYMNNSCASCTEHNSKNMSTLSLSTIHSRSGDNEPVQMLITEIANSQNCSSKTAPCLMSSISCNAVSIHRSGCDNSSGIKRNSICGITSLLKEPSCIKIYGYSSLPRTKGYSKSNASAIVCATHVPELEENRLPPAFKDAVQLVLTCLPVSSRRQLHLLLRMLNKISRNNKLLSESAFLTKDFLLETFLPAALGSYSYENWKKGILLDVFSLLVDECEAIMKPSLELKDEVQTISSDLRRRKIKYSLDDVCSLTYCEMISRQQYEEQKFTISQQALLDLLEKIIRNENISEKNKRRQLRQFKINHPDVYTKRFPTIKDEEKIFFKVRKPLLSKFLSMRM